MLTAAVRPEGPLAATPRVPPHPPAVAPGPSPTCGPGSGQVAGLTTRTTARARPPGPRSRRLSGAWNFGLASLYNAAMLRPPAPGHAPLTATRSAAGRARTTLTRGLALGALFSSMTLSLTAHAAPPPAAPKSAKPPSARTAKPATPGGRAGNKVISLDDEFLVEGKLEKPSAFYVLRRSSTDYDWARLDAVFTPLVLESVQDPLF